MFEELKEAISNHFRDLDIDEFQDQVEDLCCDTDVVFNEDELKHMFEKIMNAAIDAVERTTG